MRISHIHIREYNQFKDFTLDLRYPPDHPTKAGKPLDKVCFIGYSGTGKTSLLQLVKIALFPAFNPPKISSLDSDISTNLDGEYQIVNRFQLKNGEIIDEITQLRFKEATYTKDDEQVGEFWKGYSDRLTTLTQDYKKPNLVMYPSEYADLVNPIIQRRSLQDALGLKNEIARQEYEKYTVNPTNARTIVDFGTPEFIEELWHEILRDVQEYKTSDLSQSQQIARAFEVSIEKGEEALLAYKKWQANTTNPLDSLAEKLNPLLKHFFLQVDTAFDFQSADDLVFIKLKTTNDGFVPYQGWSTGTKQVLLTAIPLIKLDTSQAIICMDEPERSIFPDLQRWMMDYYIELAPEAQFFVATHSPIIAAQFEPCERFVLEFNDDGTIRAKQGVAPIGADPNVLLYEDFGQTSLLTEQGLKNYELYLKLHDEISVQQDPAKRKELNRKYMSLSNDYNFPLHEAYYEKH